jgi:hypothetical protein
MAALYRPEGIQHDDNFGFGTLLYTLDAKKSPYPPASAPPVPAGLIADGGVGSVLLTWSPCKGADGFIVSRATSPDGPFAEVANYRGIFPVWSDAKADAGTTYYYRVAARNASGASDVSAIVHGTPAAMQDGLPEGWSQVDIGDCKVKGTVSHADIHGVTIGMTGSGTDGIGVDSDINDAFSFVYKNATGDFMFTAHRLSAGGDGGWPSRQGIMIREKLDRASKAVALVIGDLGRREARFGARYCQGSQFFWQYGNGYSAGNTWLRLARVGCQYRAYQSLDGIKWYQVGSPIAVHMAGDVYVGLAVSSDSDKLNNAVLDSMSIK